MAKKTKTEPWLLFTWNYQYPNGGWNDYRGSFETLDDLYVAATRELDKGREVFQIVSNGDIIGQAELKELPRREY